MPEEFATYLNYCRGLKFDEKPNYMYLLELFKKLFQTLNYKYDFAFDWSMVGKKITSCAMQLNSTAPNISATEAVLDRRERKRARYRDHYG